MVRARNRRGGRTRPTGRRYLSQRRLWKREGSGAGDAVDPEWVPDEMAVRAALKVEGKCLKNPWMKMTPKISALRLEA
jgi:hypothetical protein